jgi:hypothetical protein
MRSGLDGHAAGASAVIFGLLAACMIWAPRNELNCTAIIVAGFRTFVFDWDFYYTTVAMLYIGQEVFALVLWGALGGELKVSEMGHLSGAFWGGVVAIILLKARLVDCEGWDLFTVWAKYRKLTREWNAREKRLDHQKMVERSSLKARARGKTWKGEAMGDGADGAGAGGPTPEERAAAAVRRVRSLIDEGDVAGALAAYEKAAHNLYNWPSQPDLYGLIKAFHARGAEPDSVRLMRDHCKFYPAASSKVRLKLAQILMLNCQRPTAALRVLEGIPPASLSENLETTRQKLARQAERMREEGVLELEGDD